MDSLIGDDVIDGAGVSWDRHDNLIPVHHGGRHTEAVASHEYCCWSLLAVGYW